MSLEALVGRRYGPVVLRVSSEKVAEFVAATGDLPADRVAPPGWAAVVLFAVVPSFLSDPVVAPLAKVLVHVDQLFQWQRPLQIGEELEVSGTLEAVRRRGELFFATFGVSATDSGGTLLLEAASTFLASEQAVTRQEYDEEPEPAWDARQNNQAPLTIPLPAEGESVTMLEKSAARADLVRYAGASGDWNPIHWDHAAGVAAGFPGVICHGLLMAAWVSQAAGRVEPQDFRLSQLRLRFRAPLRPGVATTIEGSVTERSPSQATLALVLREKERELVTADAVLSRAGSGR